MSEEYLFQPAKDTNIPLSEQLRPINLEQFIGQKSIIGPNCILQKIIESDELVSFILWGPAGVGKTTIANIIQNNTKHKFHKMSAVLSGIKDVKAVMENAKTDLIQTGTKTILFMDEIHRFNKAQQDAFLPYVESGSIILIGATTENPSFSIISPLLSRVKIFVLNKLSNEDLLRILERGLALIKKEYKIIITINETIKNKIVTISNGDGRKCYGILELLLKLATNSIDKNFTVTKQILENILQMHLPDYDKSGEFHYDYISALHKSMRNSDIDAALYYTVKMLESGEDPLYMMRRIIRFSSEDIGLADPNAISVSTSALNALNAIGMPEAVLSILEAVAYNTLAPKSNSLYQAYTLIKEEIQQNNDLEIPYNLRNNVTQLMSDLGYGKNYQYAHNFDIPITGMQCLPDKIKDKKFYLPKGLGFEKELKRRVEQIFEIKNNLNDTNQTK